MHYLLFIDESGNHNLKVTSHNDNFLAICGVLVSKTNYALIDRALKDFKTTVFNSPDIILHSREIRNQINAFAVLSDKRIRKRFMDGLAAVIKDANFKIICPIIDKGEVLNRFGQNADNVYHTAVTFLLERVRYILQSIEKGPKQLTIIAESRNPKENAKLKKYIEGIISTGTIYMPAADFAELNIKVYFNNKHDNISGLQLADLFAYPIMRQIIFPFLPNPAYALILDKMHKYRNTVEGAGIKVFPK